ncbi:MAG TPA: cytochrome c biogenesis protein CcdA [Acidimicrobiales bacterium]
MLDPAAIHADPLGLLVAFGAGMLSFLSPCVLPLVPAYLSMVSGLSAAELNALHPVRPTEPERPPVPAALTVAGVVPAPAGEALPSDRPTPAPPGVSLRGDGPTPADLAQERGRLLRGILAFIAGFTVIFTILGASASAVGRLFLTHQRALETVSGILIVVFGAVLVGLAAGLSLPMALSGERRFAVRPSALGSWAPPIMGMAFAFAWTPCIGPVLASVLALAAGTGGSETGGIALLLAYSLGLGVPFLLSGLAFGRMTDVLARVRSRLRLVDLVGGAILVVFGILLLTGNVSVISAHISTWLHDLHLDRLSVS